MRTLPILALSALILLSSACASTFAQRRGAEPEERPAPTLLGGLTVLINQNEGSAGGLATLAGNLSLPEFGEMARPEIYKFFEERGFAVYEDPDRAHRLDGLRLEGAANAIAALTGMWTDPKASHTLPGNMTVPLFGEMNAAATAKALGADAGKREFFSFHEIIIGEGGDFTCGILPIYSHPTVTLESVVIDSEGKKIFHARGEGNAEGGFFGFNRSPDNLRVGLTRALENLRSVEETTLR